MKSLRILFLFSAAIAVLFLSSVARMSDKLQFVADEPNRPLVNGNDKLKFIGLPKFALGLIYLGRRLLPADAVETALLSAAICCWRQHYRRFARSRSRLLL